MSAARTASDADFEQAVIARDKPVLVDFWAEWCGPCRAMGPIVEALAEAHADRVEVVKVNLDEAPETAQKYGISSIPALLLFEHGAVVQTLVGAKPRGMIEKALGAYLS